jgi:hypothetical protein
MTVVFTIAETTVTPRTVVRTPTIPANIKRIKFSCTMVGWPVGDCVRLSCLFPDGSAGPAATLAQGINPKTGLPTTEGFYQVELIDPQTFATINLPSGQYTFTAEILQTITTAITVEVF